MGGGGGGLPRGPAKRKQEALFPFPTCPRSLPPSPGDLPWTWEATGGCSGSSGHDHTVVRQTPLTPRPVPNIPVPYLFKH